jgi:hypothetical protein
MHSRRVRRQRRRGRFAVSLVALAPLPAFAELPTFVADPALSAWGAYLFFAIVATVVIVLLLHEALEDHPGHEPPRDERAREAFGKTKTRFGAHDVRGTSRTGASRGGD